MLQGHQEAGVAAIFHLHAVIRAVIDPAFPVAGDTRHIDIRPAIHLVMSQERQVIEIDLIACLNNLFYRRRIFTHDHRPDSSRFPPQAFTRHFGAIHVARHAERHLHFLLRILRAHDDLHIARLAVGVERLL
jgi:hypothetical protein